MDEGRRSWHMGRVLLRLGLTALLIGAVATTSSTTTAGAQADDCAVAAELRQDKADFNAQIDATEASLIATLGLTNAAPVITRLEELRAQGNASFDAAIAFFAASCAATARQSLPGVVVGSTNWSLRDSLTSGPATTTFSYGTRPLVPLMGDWDGDGDKTAGTYEAGTFKLRNANSAGPPDVSFAFGDPRGFPVAGDFDGDGLDDVAVYRNGLWQLRFSDDGVTTSFNFGTGSWPSTVAVAGDWDGDGIDGIGTYTLATGTWALRQTASAGAPDAGEFVFWTGPGSYPVVGDWEPDGDDSVGVKNGATWSLNFENDSSAADLIITFGTGASNEFPVVWA